MCVIAWAWKVHPRWPLVVLANRDERHARASAPLQWWQHDPEILAGRDLEAGGTWLGVTRAGRLAALTNRGGAKPPGAPSRGDLVTTFLTSAASPEKQIGDVGARAAGYAGFNLLAGDGARLVCVSNRAPVETLEAGIHGMANAELDEPIPKVERLKAALASWVQTEEAPQRDAWLHLLEDAAPAEPGRPASAIFVHHAIYGTRSSSIVAFGSEGRAIFVERGFDAHGRGGEPRQFEFEVSA